MVSVKARLKAAKAAFDSHKYEDALTEVQEILDVEPNHYHATVFAGAAYTKLGQYLEAERAYDAAAKVKSDDALVWQGAISLFELQGKDKLDEYGHAAIRLGEIYGKQNIIVRCKSVIDKYVYFTKIHGTKLQYAKALEVYLPTSSVYGYLEGRITTPAQTYSTIVTILEAEEKATINKEIGERRTRLGAKFNDVNNEVRCEVLSASPLEHLYQEIINWTHDDNERHTFEEKLLQHAYDTLIVLPKNKKPSKREEVLKMAEGMVIIKYPFALAWSIALEWKDAFSISDWDMNLLCDYMKLFPEDGLTKVFTGYMTCDISPFRDRYVPEEEDDENKDAEEKESSKTLDIEDRLLLMTEGLEDCSSSMLAHRMMAELFLELKEYASAIDTVQKGKRIVKDLERQTCLKFRENIDATNVILANAFISYQSPKNHPEAKSMFEEMLSRKPNLTPALIGVGLILEEAEDYSSAISFLTKASERDTSNLRVRAEAAWCKALSGQYETCLAELEDCLADIDGTDERTKDLKAEILFRIGYCKWNADTSKAARKDRTGAYANFLAALQTNINFAPAYTYLGFYYADYAKDRKRARKCFQKAFDLSAAEVEAAERMAKIFADQGDWDLVEIVSQRVIDSGKVRPAPGSKKKGISWPFSALGVVQLNRQEYANSIVSFQSALKISPDDYHAWVGLGESYHNAGRYMAATKAFQQVEKLAQTTNMQDNEHKWFPRFMLANVHKELGEYDEAIAGYSEVLQSRPNEFGVMINLLQTFVDGAWRNVELGFFGRAIDNAIKALDLSITISETRIDSFNLWKGVGDACSIFSLAGGRINRFPVDKVGTLLRKQIDLQEYNVLSEFDATGSSLLDSSNDSASVENVDELRPSIRYTILAYKRAIHVSMSDQYAQAVAWFNLGYAENSAHNSIAIKDTALSTKSKHSGFLKAAVRCFKKAIELEAGNSEFWDALGVVTTTLNPKVAQHCFVRSLNINDKSPRVWTNLGALYLLQNDFQLANEAFSRAQSADPDYGHAWLGQGFIAVLIGDFKEAHLLFTHAFEISDSSSVAVKRQYALSSFDNLFQSTSDSSNISNLVYPFFALRQLHSQSISSFAYSHLSALFAERMSNFPEAIEFLDETCTEAEREYEVSQTTASLIRYAQAKADAARSYLAMDEYEAAAENGDMCLNLSSDDSVRAYDEKNWEKFRLSAHLTCGLAYYYLGDIEKSIDMFRQALEESDDSPDVVCLLSQVLWAKGGDEERGVAREQLLDCVEKHPNHVRTVALLGVIAILDGDFGILDAVTSDLHTLRMRDDLTHQQQLRISKVISAATVAQCNECDESTQEDEIFAEITSSIMISPFKPQGWQMLAKFSSELYPAEMGIKTARNAVPPRGSLDAPDLCLAFAQTSKPSDAQRAIMIAPWIKDGWESLAA